MSKLEELLELNGLETDEAVPLAEEAYLLAEYAAILVEMLMED